jgi:hypothetical protein
MKRFGGISAVLSTAVLFLVFGTPSPAQAFQEEHPQDAKPAEGAKPAPKEESKPPKDAKPAPKPKQESKPPQDAKPTTHDQEAKPPKEDKPPKDTNAPKAANAPKENKDARPAEHAETRQPAKSTVKHGPIENGRIPDAQFHSHFGHEHTFKVGHPVVVGGQSRFQFGGYWFGFSEGWPVGWAYTDDVYVDYIDGEYFLIDPVHPGIRLQLIVVV